MELVYITRNSLHRMILGVLLFENQTLSIYKQFGYASIE